MVDIQKVVGALKSQRKKGKTFQEIAEGLVQKGSEQGVSRETIVSKVREARDIISATPQEPIKDKIEMAVGKPDIKEEKIPTQPVSRVEQVTAPVVGAAPLVPEVETKVETPEDKTREALLGQREELEAQREARARGLEEQQAKEFSSFSKTVNLQRDEQLRQLREAQQAREKSAGFRLGLAGAARSTAASEAMDSIAAESSSQQAIVQAKFDELLRRKEAELKGASDEELQAIDERVRQIDQAIAENEINLAKQIQTLNVENKVRGEEAMQSFVGALTPAGRQNLQNKGFDSKTSQALGYISDKFGTPLFTDDQGNPMPFETKVDDQGNEVLPKITQFKDGNENTYVYKNGELDQVITNRGEIIRGTQITRVPTEVKAAIDDSKTKDFQNNLRKEYNALQEIKRFKDINASFNRVTSGLKADTAAGDLVGIFSYMKMLDPGSVVREGEFANAQNAGGVSDKVRNMYNKLLTGERLTPEQRTDFVGRSRDIFNDERNIVSNVNNKYTEIAGDLGVNPAFVVTPINEFGELRLEETIIQQDDRGEIDDIFGDAQPAPTTPTTPTTIKTTSGFQFDLSGFNGAEEAAVSTTTTEIPTTGFTDNLNLVRTGTNVAKDTNNPGNITADSVPKAMRTLFGKKIGATGTYRSPNGRLYYVFPNVETGTSALTRDIRAKVTGSSRVIQPTASLNDFVRIYTGNFNPGYLNVLKNTTGATDTTQIKDINVDKLVQGIMKAEGFTK